MNVKFYFVGELKGFAQVFFHFCRILTVQGILSDKQNNSIKQCLKTPFVSHTYKGIKRKEMFVYLKSNQYCNMKLCL